MSEIWEKVRRRVYQSLGGMAALVSILVGIESLDLRWWPWKWELDAIAAEARTINGKLTELQEYIYAREQLELERDLRDVRKQLELEPSDSMLVRFEAELERRILDVRALRQRALHDGVTVPAE